MKTYKNIVRYFGAFLIVSLSVVSFDAYAETNQSSFQISERDYNAIVERINNLDEEALLDRKEFLIKEIAKLQDEDEEGNGVMFLSNGGALRLSLIHI